MIYQSDRVFQLWDYTVGHAQLLLRSPATTDEPFNIDIVFLGVETLDIPTRMEGLSMEKPERLARSERDWHNPPDHDRRQGIRRGRCGLQDL